jgi:Phage-integrase repeat unit
LKLNTFTGWRQYAKSGNRPADIPAHPQDVYSRSGWAGWGDWLRTGRIATRLRDYRSFKKARTFARSLGLNSNIKWRDYCELGKLPEDIPANPSQTYAETGWTGWGDWLGTGYVYQGLRRYRPFKKARAFARSLRLKSQPEWRAYCQSGKKPADIPSNPNHVYANDGWLGIGDWLGTGTVATSLRRYRSFKKARAFARSLGFKSSAEWATYCKSQKKPADIPIAPNAVYANSGWAGMGDWLDTGKVRRGQHRGHLKRRAPSCATSD